jgi:hypothetical protein
VPDGVGHLEGDPGVQVGEEVEEAPVGRVDLLLGKPVEAEGAPHGVEGEPSAPFMVIPRAMEALRGEMKWLRSGSPSTISRRRSNPKALLGSG